MEYQIYIILLLQIANGLVYFKIIWVEYGLFYIISLKQKYMDITYFHHKQGQLKKIFMEA